MFWIANTWDFLHEAILGVSKNENDWRSWKEYCLEQAEGLFLS